MGFSCRVVSVALVVFFICILVNSWFRERKRMECACVVLRLFIVRHYNKFKSLFSISVLGKDFQCNIFWVQCLRRSVYFLLLLWKFRKIVISVLGFFYNLPATTYERHNFYIDFWLERFVLNQKWMVDENWFFRCIWEFFMQADSSYSSFFFQGIGKCVQPINE